MDNTREKLIELLVNSPGLCTLTGKEEEFAENADWLIGNGATVLPCEVGQKIWIVYTPKYPANPNDKGKWFMAQDGVQRIIFGARGLSIETWNVGTIPGKEIGKKLFFTREEAEAKLYQHRQRGTDNEIT